MQLHSQAEKPNVDAILAEDIARFFYDPLGYVEYVFPWGEEGTALADEEGPDEWQSDILLEIGEALKGAKTATRISVASGHGIGKTALTAWIIHWFIATRMPDVAGVVTANTKAQLKNKTWRELAKWNGRALNGHWFNWQAEKFALKGYEGTVFIAAQPWTKENSEAFAGLHEKNVLVLYDEASAVDDIIWEVSEGAMTEAGALWLAMGNPTRNTGRFRQTFGRDRRLWITRQIDSRTAKRTNKAQIREWEKTYGKDSDFMRVRVHGKFPRAGSMQMIPSDRVTDARTRNASSLSTDPVVIGVDVARFGDDRSVITPRKGRDARSIPWTVFRGADTMTLAAETARIAREHNASAIFVDVTGVGGGVVDRLRQLHLPTGCEVYEVGFGDAADAGWQTQEIESSIRFRNKAAEMWWIMREWMRRGAIPDDQELEDDLVGREYGYDADNQIVAEKKDDMRNRGLQSPDAGDALALTFAYPVGINASDLPDSSIEGVV